MADDLLVFETIDLLWLVEQENWVWGFKKISFELIKSILNSKSPDARGDHRGDTGLGVDPVGGVPGLQQPVAGGVGEGVQHGDGAAPQRPLVQRLVTARTLERRPDLK